MAVRLLINVLYLSKYIYITYYITHITDKLHPETKVTAWADNALFLGAYQQSLTTRPTSKSH